MDFWNDYEGRTIDGKFPLERLLYPEGRSGFFATSNGTGTPAVIRITETLNDEQDIFEQWRIVQGLRHPNLVTIRSYGQTTLEDTPLIFAVLEPSDATLADILKERLMTADETREIATSLLAALQSIHSAGLIHGHVEPASVVAVGEVIKLRSDCVRKLPGGSDGNRLKALEAQDFATLLLESLTQQRRQQSATLPAPFDAIIRNGIAGAWGLEEMSKALAPAGPSTAQTTAVAPSPEEDTVEEPIEDPEKVAPPSRSINSSSSSSFEPSGEPWPRRTSPWIMLGSILLLLVLSVIYFLHRGHTTQPAAANPTASPAPAIQSTPTPNQIPVKPPASNSAATALPTEQASVSNPPRQFWRVVAYTYNQQEQAQKKVNSIEQRYDTFKPEVFTPTGKAPYLVTLGGPMTHDEAVALKRKAQSQGLPRDTYVQNYAK